MHVVSTFVCVRVGATSKIDCVHKLSL